MVIKTVGSSGQISLGKQYAGRHVLVDELEPGVWVIKIGDFVPENERWLHAPEVKAQLDEGLAWAARNPRQETNLNRLEESLRNDRADRAGSARSQ